MPRRFLWSLGHARRGLVTVWREERNFRIQTAGAGAMLILGLVVGLTLGEWMAVALAGALVLSGEILNTVVEDLLNKIEPNHDPFIGKLKDMMAGYVLVTSLVAVVIAALVLAQHWA